MGPEQSRKMRLTFAETCHQMQDLSHDQLICSYKSATIAKVETRYLRMKCQNYLCLISFSQEDTKGAGFSVCLFVCLLYSSVVHQNVCCKVTLYSYILISHKTDTIQFRIYFLVIHCHPHIIHHYDSSTHQHATITTPREMRRHHITHTGI